MQSRLGAHRRVQNVIRRSARGLAVAALTASLVTCANQAQAAPAMTLTQAQAKVQQLETAAALLDEKANGVTAEINTIKTDLTQRQADLAAQTAKVATMRAQLGQLALAQFQNRNLDTRAQLFLTQDTEGFLSQISTVQKISDNQTATLQTFQAQQASLADLQRAETADLAGLETNQADLATLRADSAQKVASAKAVLAKLTEEQRQKIAAEEQKQEAAAAKAALAGLSTSLSNNRVAVPTTTEDGSGDASSTASTSADSTSTGSDSSSDGADNTTSTTPTSSAGSGKAAKALAFAMSQRGKAYRFGATGPNAYDCSGLTFAAYRSVGISLDRTAAQQFHDGVAVAKSDLQPGDLVFFYGSSPGHVGIYIGNGYIVHAPNPRRSVEVVKLSSMPYSGARRVS